jgi:uncharacterized protein (TIGR00106 family)
MGVVFPVRGIDREEAANKIRAWFKSRTGFQPVIRIFRKYPTCVKRQVGNLSYFLIRPKKKNGEYVMILLELSIFPLDKGDSVSPYVTRCLDIIDRSGINYRSNSMGTVLEGGYAEVMDVVRQCFEALAVDCNRIECSMKLDYRKGRTNRLEAKIASVEQKLGRKLRT